jgi:hypothetical protein
MFFLSAKTGSLKISFCWEQSKRPLRSRASEISLDQTRRVSERSEFSSCSKLIEKRREPDRASFGLAFFGSFFGHAKNERPSGSA